MPQRRPHTPTAAQSALIERIRAFLEGEPRVEAAWLSGSLGRGEGDEFSDVDVLVLVAPGAAASLAAELSARLPAIAPPVLVNSLGGRLLNVVTADWQRFDLYFIEGEAVARFDANALKPLFNRGSRAPMPQEARPYAPSPEAVTKIVEDFLRVLGLAVVGLGRREYVVTMWGVELLLRTTLALMLEENRIPPAARGGALHPNAFLTDAQRAELEGCPPLLATHDSAMAANRYIASVFLPRAKRLAAEIGAAWPEALEAATRRSLKQHLGLSLDGP